MTSSFVVSAVWLLCMLGAAAHAARPVARMTDVLQMAVAFALSFALAVLFTPQPNWISLCVAILAMWRLLQGLSPRTDRVLGGVCAGLAAALHLGSGVPAWLAIGAPVVILAVAIWMARGFARETGPGREIALVAAALVAPIVGLAPDIAAGWRSAEVLNRAAGAPQVQAIPAWAISFVVLALVAGAARAFWIRR
jgi:phage shock protein PspC (stress-responsive transcriptional regulator)